jgi:hypothetical protein
VRGVKDRLGLGGEGVEAALTVIGVTLRSILGGPGIRTPSVDVLLHYEPLQSAEVARSDGWRDQKPQNPRRSDLRGGISRLWARSLSRKRAHAATRHSGRLGGPAVPHLRSGRAPRAPNRLFGGLPAGAQSAEADGGAESRSH